MAKDTSFMGQSMAGLQRFNNADKSKFRIRPQHVIVLLIIVVLVVILLHWQGSNWLGLPA